VNESITRTAQFGRPLLAGLLLAVALAALGWVMAAWLGIERTDLQAGLTAARREPWLVFVGVIALLAADSVLSIPTVVTIAMAGHLLGTLLGGMAGFAGVLGAGSVCFWAGRLTRGLGWIQSRRARELSMTIDLVGPTLLLMARVAPMLPEVASAMAGASGFKALRYYLYFSVGNLPFAFIVAYAGSVSSLEQPLPTLAVAGGIPTLCAVVLYWRQRRERAREPIRHGADLTR